MADEPKQDHPEDIKSILSDLDAILTDMGGDAQAAPKPAAPAQMPPKIEVPVPKPEPVKAEAAKPVEPPKAVPPPPPPPPPPPAPKLPNPKSIELSAGPAKTPPPPAPVDSPKDNQPPPKAPPAPTAVPVPVPIVASTKIEELPADTPREQIRRVAYIYTSSCSEVKTAFAAFLSQAARTISKKPLFLREVLSHEVSAASDPNAILQKSLQTKAGAILAVVEGWPAAKVDELSEACSRASVLFRAVASADAQKKSTAVDIIVDMMLLPGEG